MNFKVPLILLKIQIITNSLFAGPFSPAAGEPNTQAIAANDARITRWASNITISRGPIDATVPNGATASFGSASDAIGIADATAGNTGDPTPVVSLGDGGSATAIFNPPIQDLPNSIDIVVFENSFNDSFLELAFVEVSSDGINFFRFPSISLTDPNEQSLGFVDTTNVDGLAGKYRAGFGTGFDLNNLRNIDSLLNVDAITHIKIIDVIGSIDPSLATQDSQGNIINDPFPTPFPSAGFDLDAIGIITRNIDDLEPFEMQNRTFVLRPSLAINLPPSYEILAGSSFDNMQVIADQSGLKSTATNYSRIESEGVINECRYTETNPSAKHFYQIRTTLSL